MDITISNWTYRVTDATDIHVLFNLLAAGRVGHARLIFDRRQTPR